MYYTYLNCKVPLKQWTSTLSSVEDDLWDLPVLHAGPVVVARGVAELEGDLAAVVAVHRHLPQPLGAVVAVQPLQGADRGVVGVGLDLQGLLEHGPEGGVGAVAGESDLVGPKQPTRPRVD